MMFTSFSLKSSLRDPTELRIEVSVTKTSSLSSMIPRLRDVTVQFELKNEENGKLISIGDFFSVSNSEGYGAIRFGEKASRGDINLSAGEHTIEFSFFPQGFKIGLLASATGLLLLV